MSDHLTIDEVRITRADPNQGMGGCCLIQFLLAVIVIPPVLIATQLPHQAMLWYTLAGVTGVVMIRRMFRADAWQSLSSFFASFVVAWLYVAIVAYMVFIAYGFDSIGAQSGVWVGTPPLAAALGFVVFELVNSSGGADPP
jgi:hypothetical protein